MIKANSKSQSWSIDIALGVIVFMGAFFIFYALLNANPNTKLSDLKEEASTVIKQVASEENKLGIVDGNELNITKAGEVKNLSYDDLKARLRAEGDFCIYVEDEKGNIVPINDSYKGIGSQNIVISGTPCSQR